MNYLKTKKKILGGLIAVFFTAGVPLVVSAAATFSEVVGKILEFLEQVGVALIGLAALLLVYGIVRYITAGGDPQKISEGGKVIMWGVIALFVMVSMWGIVKLVLFSVFSTSSSGFELNDQLFNP